MSGADVTGPGLFGKMPAHGDFIRRGGPAGLLVVLDSWLQRELGSVLAEGRDEGDPVTMLDGLRIGFSTDEGGATAVLVASRDAVGREFPLVAVTAAQGTLAEAERWCSEAEAALIEARDGHADADATFLAIGVIASPAGDDGQVTGWWRAGGEPEGEGLPVGAAFRSALGELP